MTKSSLNSQKNHTYRWYDDKQPCKISCPNSTSFVRYKNNKYLTNHLDNFLTWNLFFLYLTDEVEFGQDILQCCLSSYHLYVWFFCEFRLFFVIVCTDFHEVVVCTRYVPIYNPSGGQRFLWSIEIHMLQLCPTV